MSTLRLAMLLMVADRGWAPALLFDESTWYLPQGAGTFFGRTQIKPPAFGGNNLRPLVARGVITLQLDTQ